MSNIRNFYSLTQGLFLFFTVFWITGCKKPPEYSDVPVLTEVTQAGFSQGIPNDTLTPPDTIKLGVYFRDGNGNMGLTDADAGWPYHEINFILNDDGERIQPGDPGAPAVGPCNYHEGADGNLYLGELNEAHNNFIVDFYTQQPDGSFQKEDLCIGYSGRFPPIYKDEVEEVLEGNIKYTITSYFFPKGYVKFDIAVYDRALNKSNTVTTPPIFVQ